MLENISNPSVNAVMKWKKIPIGSTKLRQELFHEQKMKVISLSPEQPAIGASALRGAAVVEL